MNRTFLNMVFSTLVFILFSYPRELGNGKGQVSIRGKTFPVVGNVCMDMLMVDLGSVEGISDAGALVSIGDTAYLWGPEDDDDSDAEGEIRLQDIASILKTTQSALTCGLDKVRVQRHYVD
jgi:alanine racemase